MTSVKAGFAEDEQHLQVLVGLLFNRIHDGLGVGPDEGWHGLRRSHLRILHGVPAEGTSVTDLAERVGLTKQGCGQLVTQLVDLGHVQVGGHPEDGRVRLVRRTGKGSLAMREFCQAVAQVEVDLAAEVGRERYRAFREVLEDLVLQ